MPGSGKSSLGKAAAHALAMDFVDTDDLIVAAHRQSLQQQLNEFGVDVLRQRESDIISQLDCGNTIIATGGSAVYGFEGMQRLQQISHIVFLRVAEEVLLSRIDNMSERGIAKPASQSFSEMMIERVALYERYADYIIDANDEAKINQMIDYLANLVRIKA